MGLRAGYDDDDDEEKEREKMKSNQARFLLSLYFVLPPDRLVHSATALPTLRPTRPTAAEASLSGVVKWKSI